MAKNRLIKRLPKFLINIALLVTSVIFIFVIFEIVLRIYCPIYAPITKNEHAGVDLMEYSPHFGWEHKKNITTWVKTSEYDNEIFLNANRLRGKLYNYEKPLGIKRILMLGDSFVFGLGVNDNQTFSVKLEELLNRSGPKAEVINMGVNGFGTDQEYLFLREEGLKYSPDVVICFLFVGNDIRENGSVSQYGRYKPYFTLSGGDLKLNNYPVPRSEIDVKDVGGPSEPKAKIWLPFGKDLLQKYSYTYIFLRLRYNYLLFKLGIRKSNEFNTDLNWEITQAILIDMKRLCQSNKCRFITVIVPTKEQLLGAEDVKFQGEFQAFAKKNSLEYIDLLALLKGRSDLNFVIDSHWNKKGHEHIARVLFDALKD
jgi:hypothetical protein